MKKREPIELKKRVLPPKSAQLARIRTGLKTNATLLTNLFKFSSEEDVGDTEQGKRLRGELWAAKQKLEGLVHQIARVSVDYRRLEAGRRADKKLEALGVDPEEVKRRGDKPKLSECVECGEMKRDPEDFSDGLRCTICVNKALEKAEREERV